MILEESLVGSPLVQIVWQRLQRARFNLPLILSFVIIIHIVEPSRTQGTKVCKYTSIPGVVTVCSYPTEVTL